MSTPPAHSSEHPLPDLSEIASMIDHAVLHPAQTDADIEAGCRLAARCAVAAVCVKPCNVS